MRKFLASLACIVLLAPVAPAQFATANSMAGYSPDACYARYGTIGGFAQIYDLHRANETPSDIVGAGAGLNVTGFQYPGLQGALSAIGVDGNHGYTFNFLMFNGSYEVHTGGIYAKGNDSLFPGSSFPPFSEGGLSYPGSGLVGKIGCEWSMQYFPGSANDYNDCLCFLTLVRTTIQPLAAKYKNQDGTPAYWFDGYYYCYIEQNGSPNSAGQYCVTGANPSGSYCRLLNVESWDESIFRPSKGDTMFMFTIPYYWSSDLLGRYPVFVPGNLPDWKGGLDAHVINFAQYGIQWGWFNNGP